MPSLRSAFAQIPIISSVRPVGADRAAWLVDIWGVLHNGAEPFKSAVEACLTFKAQGGRIVLISNSPRPKSGAVQQMRDIGVPDDAYDDAVTSGDATRNLIAENRGQAIFHLGPERDRAMFEGLDVSLVSAEDCEAVVCTGLFDDTSETPEDYEAMLTGFAKRGISMICANPDIRVERAGQIVYCAGALADRFAELGGDVTLAGKPHPPIYDLALARLCEVAQKDLGAGDVLAIGDGVNTDILGARMAGIDALYIASAVHLDQGKLDPTALMRLFPEPEGRPLAAMTGLVW